MKTRQFLLMIVLLLNLIACSQNSIISTGMVFTPTLTPWMAGTQTALANPTPMVEGIASLTPLPTFPAPEVTQGVLEKPTDFSPVLYGGELYDSEFFFLLGGVSRNMWFTPDDSVAHFSREVTYNLNTLTQASKYFVFGKAPEFSPTCKVYTINTDAGLGQAGFVGVVDGRKITKREVTELSPDGEFYRQATLDWLVNGGMDDPQSGNMNVFRVDIEGDGSDEIFISATHLDGTQHTTKAGDYSIVIMRKVVGNIVLTIPIVADVYSSQEEGITFPRTYSIANFMDLNQDGVLEMVVDIQKWEGFGAIAYQIDGQDVTQSLMAEC